MLDAVCAASVLYRFLFARAISKARGSGSVWLHKPRVLSSRPSTRDPAKRETEASGEIPRMHPLPCRSEVFSPNCVCYPLPHARWFPFQVLGLHPPSWSGTLYVGIAGFFDQRIHQHKYDSIEGPRLVYYESYHDAQVAISREKQVKRWREKKIALDGGFKGEADLRAEPAVLGAGAFGLGQNPAVWSAATEIKR
jgi:predicted GIY-YIG superfamily endonuclease